MTSEQQQASRAEQAGGAGGAAEHHNRDEDVRICDRSEVRDAAVKGTQGGVRKLVRVRSRDRVVLEQTLTDEWRIATRYYLSIDDLRQIADAIRAVLEWVQENSKITIVTEEMED